MVASPRGFEDGSQHAAAGVYAASAVGSKSNRAVELHREGRLGSLDYSQIHPIGLLGFQRRPKQTGEPKSPSKKPTITSEPACGNKAAPVSAELRHIRAHIVAGDTAGTVTNTRPKS
jgi:hypothetical protein